MDLKIFLLLTLLFGVIGLFFIASYTTRYPLNSVFKLILNAESLPQPHPSSLWCKCLLLTLTFTMSAVVIDIFIRLKSDHTNYLSTYYALFFFMHQAEADSWDLMIKALRYFESLSTASVYEALILKDFTKFQYPPSSLLIFDIPKRLFNFSYEQLVVLFNQISWVCIPIISITFFYFQKSAAKELSSELSEDDESSTAITTFLKLLLSLLLSFIAILMFYPITRSYQLGQIQTLITLFAGVSLLAWQKQRFGLAGVLMSICCSFKPQWAVLVPWAILRKQWAFLISFSITSIAIFLISTAFYGLKNWFDYVKVLSMLSKFGESFYPNQSVNGLFHRIFMNGNNIEWAGNAYPPYHSTVYIATLVSSIMLLGLAVLWKRKHKPTFIDLSIVILSLTMASPIAWEHHYGVCIFMFASAIPLTVRYRPLGRWSFIYLWVTYLLVSQNYGYRALGLANTHWNFLQSTLFFGALMLLYYFYKLSQKQHQSHRNVLSLQT